MQTLDPVIISIGETLIKFRLYRRKYIGEEKWLSINAINISVIIILHADGRPGAAVLLNTMMRFRNSPKRIAVRKTGLLFMRMMEE